MALSLVWFVALALSPGLVIPAAELRWRFSRASGPGGQHVNTTDSRVELVFDLDKSAVFTPAQRARLQSQLANRLVEGCLVITASERRSQWQNRALAQQRLGQVLQEALRPPPPPRRPSRPTRGSVERRLAAKKRRSSLKGQRNARVQLPEA